MPKQENFTDRPNNHIGVLWSKYATKIYKECFYRTESEEAAKDLFQDVALKFCKNVPRLNLGGSLWSWFYAVIRTTHYDKNRKVFTEIPMSVLKEETSCYSALPSTAAMVHRENIQKQRNYELLQVFLDILNPEERQILEGISLGEVSKEVLSKEIGIPLWKFSKLYTKAIKKIRESKERKFYQFKKSNMPVSVLEVMLQKSIENS